MPDLVAPRSDLAALIGGACTDPAGHLVVADWLEEHLGRDDLACVLRLSTFDPRPLDNESECHFDEFRFQLIEAHVELCMATWRVVQPSSDSGLKAGPEQQGYLVTLCAAKKVAGRLVRWVRWLPTEDEVAAEVLALWDRLGETVTEPPALYPDE